MDTATAVRELYSEVDCRIEHGAESGGHLEFVRQRLVLIRQTADEEAEAIIALGVAVQALQRIADGDPQPVTTATEVLLNLLGRIT